MRTYSVAHLCWVKLDMQPIVVQKLGLDPVSPADAKLPVSWRFYCSMIIGIAKTPRFFKYSKSSACSTVTPNATSALFSEI